MDFYLFSLLLGFAGLAFMALAGMHHGHGGHGHGGHDVGDVSLGQHAGHGALHSGGGTHGAGHAPAISHGAHGAHAQEHVWDVSHRVGGFLLSLLTPRALCSLLLGVGLVGMLAEPWTGGLLQALIAVAGALGVEMVVIRPMWKLLSGFASPARTLESAVMEPARAASAFDANGQGLVAIEVDGQITQILGTLRPVDRELGVRVRAGDRLLVEEVDPQRNRCVVSYLGS